MNNEQHKLHRRYPGLKPFERSHSALFRGRSEDVQRLSNLIIRERLVVLFAKSGIGKTSLLQAGVALRLEANGFAPIFLRSDHTTDPLAPHVYQTLEKHESVGGRYEKYALPNAQPSLWEQIKRLETDIDGIPATPVLILDQFEETYTLQHTQASRDQYLDQIADLANETTPLHIRELLTTMAGSGEEQPTSQEFMQWWEKQPDLRIVISIRSDFLHLLDDISPRIPGILRNRYQLQPLNRPQAQEAIVEPARAVGEFLSPSFTYTPEAINVILDYLAGRETTAEVQAADASALLKKQDEIESFNLQILCQHVEETVMERYPFGPINPELGASAIVVDPDFYGNKAGLEREIKDFYIKQLQNLPETYKKRTNQDVENPARMVDIAQRLIEEDLVTQAGRRCSVVDDSLTDRWQVTQEFLDTLVETRLLRKELRLDDFYYEITHDTMLPAIIDSRDKRREREREDLERERLTSELRAEALRSKKMEEELLLMRKQRKLARTVGLLSFGMLLLSIGFGIWFTRSWAYSTLDDFYIAEENCRNEQFDAAIRGYGSLKNGFKQKLFSDPLDSNIVDAQRFKTLYYKIQNDQQLGDSLVFLDGKDEFARALTAYRSALNHLEQYEIINYTWKDKRDTTKVYHRVDPNRITERRNALKLRIKSTRNTLITQFVVRQREAESFKEAGMTGQQCRNLRTMEALLPTDQEDWLELKTKLQLGKQSPNEYVAEEIRQAGGCPVKEPRN
jgi:hypothetical protein